MVFLCRLDNDFSLFKEFVYHGISLVKSFLNVVYFDVAPSSYVNL